MSQDQTKIARAFRDRPKNDRPLWIDWETIEAIAIAINRKTHRAVTTDRPKSGAMAILIESAQVKNWLSNRHRDRANRAKNSSSEYRDHNRAKNSSSYRPKNDRPLWIDWETIEATAIAINRKTHDRLSKNCVIAILIEQSRSTKNWSSNPRSTKNWSSNPRSTKKWPTTQSRLRNKWGNRDRDQPKNS